MLITVARYSFPHEAHLAKAKLDAMGIPSFIADEHTINMQWLYSNALGGVRLQVPSEFAAEAQAALIEPAVEVTADEVEIAPTAADTCAYCGGKLSEPLQTGRPPGFLTWLFPALAVRQVRYCTRCGRTSRA